MSNNRITASAETLMTQGSMMAHQYFHAAIKTIDDRFGDGYAQKHPELIAAFLHTAGSDFNTAIAVQAFQDGIESITEGFAARTEAPTPMPATPNHALQTSHRAPAVAELGSFGDFARV